MTNKIQVRRGTASAAASNNAILAAGEPGWDSTNGILKIGDGTTHWNDLPAILGSVYAAGGGAARIITGPTLPAMTAGTEYVWNKTDGAGTLLDIVSGVA